MNFYLQAIFVYSFVSRCNETENHGFSYSIPKLACRMIFYSNSILQLTDKKLNGTRTCEFIHNVIFFYSNVIYKVTTQVKNKIAAVFI